MAKQERYQSRRIYIMVLIGFGAFLLLFKAAQLQVFDNSFREKAKAATIDKQILFPSRGLIYDREQELLVYNTPMYDLKAIYRKIPASLDTNLFCSLLLLSKEEFISRLSKDWQSPQYDKSLPFTFMKKIPAERFSSFLEHIHKFPGFYPELHNSRGYKKEVAPHVLGYISEVSQKDIDASEGKYARGDNKGTSGIERYYEEELRGHKGLCYILKDKWGRNVGSFRNGRLDTMAQSGRDIILSIDSELQAYAEKLMNFKKGSIVAIEPATGEILVLASAPGYPPSDLAVDHDRGEAFSRLLQDSTKPFFNRAISAQYPPGSIFKPILALIGLQQGFIEKDYWKTCNGAYYFKSVSWGCHAGPGIHNTSSAIQHSCNTYFYDLYRRMVEKHGWSNPGKGLDELDVALAEFGLGSPLGVDLPNESSGLLPDASYYDNLYSFQDAEWRSTYIISNGIGQGEMQLTTIQMANLAAILANRGYYITPHLLQSYRLSNYPLPETFRKRQRVSIKQEHFDPVIEGMEKAISNGTAGLAYVPGIDICGKTGTSENPHGEDHSVFFAFAPKENPKIAIAVYIENAGWGGSFAAPIASLVIEKYLTDTISPHRKWLEEKMCETNLIELP